MKRGPPCRLEGVDSRLDRLLRRDNLLSMVRSEALLVAGVGQVIMFSSLSTCSSITTSSSCGRLLVVVVLVPVLVLVLVAVVVFLLFKQ